MQFNRSSVRLRWTLWMAVAAAWPLQGLAAAAIVQFAQGDVQLRRTPSTVPVVKGSEVESGDIVLTGTDGRAQLRFSDGGLVALYPNSQFTVTRYADTGLAAQDQFNVNLVRGGLRAITGWIGKREPRNYKVTTPTAVVGIRGSAFLIAFNEQRELLVSAEQDEIEVCTEPGCLGLKAGESVRVVSPSQLPLYTHTRALLPMPPPPVPWATGEQLARDRPAPPPPAEPAPPAPVPGRFPTDGRPQQPATTYSSPPATSYPVTRPAILILSPATPSPP